jgi:hypothetical protein
MQQPYAPWHAKQQRQLQLWAGEYTTHKQQLLSVASHLLARAAYVCFHWLG